MGTRPEAIKLAPVIKTFGDDGSFEVKVCSTSQHREMLDQVLRFFQITVDFDLQVMEPNQTLPDLTSRILQILSTKVLLDFRPDWLMVQGDTTTAMAGSLAGFYQKIKIGHVESGLRSHNLYSPFPEEMNRLVISKMAFSHFCPTQKAVENLAREGILEKVYAVGNTVIDGLLQAKALMRKAGEPRPLALEGLNLDKEIILVTCHRRESFGSPFLAICESLRRLADASESYTVVYPVHLNPNILNQAKIHLQHPRILLLEPLSYPDFIWLMDHSRLILTDSGGVQEEAPSLHKPVLVLRDVTERIESIEAGTAILVGTNADRIVEESLKLLSDRDHYARMAAIANPYGDGNASARILDIVRKLS